MRTDNVYDIVIIGAGAIGCAVARKLSFYDAKVLVLEKNSDVAGETSGRNSAVVHAGFNNRPGSLMAKFCVEGNKGFEELCRELDVPFKRTGKLVAATCEEEIPGITGLYEQGLANGCEGLELIDGQKAAELVPGVNAVKALYSKNSGITNPFLYCVSMAENAAENGVSFRFNEAVKEVRYVAGAYEIVTSEDVYGSNVIINCAGLDAPAIAKSAGAGTYDIYPCRGEYCILDVDKDQKLPMPVYPAPHAGIGGLGVHLTPTIEGNILLGPSAEYIDDNDDYATTSEVCRSLMEEAGKLVSGVTDINLIGAYSGIRPKLTSPEVGGYSDFIIKSEPSLPGFIDLIGIESPGLTASWPIANMVFDLVSEHLDLKQDADAVRTHHTFKKIREADEETKAELIRKDPEYGQIICRCRKVSKAEIRAALSNPLGVKTLAGVKYRAWPTTGRCNGGYCMPKIVDIMINEFGIKAEDILYRDTGSNMFTGEVK